MGYFKYLITDKYAAFFCNCDFICYKWSKAQQCSVQDNNLGGGILCLYILKETYAAYFLTIKSLSSVICLL